MKYSLWILLLCVALAAPSLAEEESTRPSNRLAKERSPYLRQHATNPVDWYPWGPEAFAKARAEDKPIFLSIGYAACHWCHVMEHESFEHEPTARRLNAAFVCIKVDREERPDLDRLYMNAVIALAGRGGWPMTVLLTPDRKPFWGGTYLSRQQTQRLAADMQRRWKTDRASLVRKAEGMAAQLRSMASGPGGTATSLSDAQLLRSMQRSLGRRYDGRRGGYRANKKFPPHGALLYYLTEGAAHATAADKAWVRRTLNAIGDGGIHDQVGGGFHRYTVDDKWLVPHFEKMLYDNALLARAYALAGTPRDRRAAERTFAWLERDLRRPAGGYASSLDADTEGHEGLTYVWTLRQLRAALPEQDYRFAVNLFGATRAGNFSEGWLSSAQGRNILFLPRSLGAHAQRAHIGKDAALTQRARVLGRLQTVRATRPQPRLDDKVITAWNALTISALAAATWNPVYRKRAEALAAFLTTHCRAADGALLRFPRDSGPPIEGFCSDYAHTIDALLDLDDATGTRRWLPIATDLGQRLLGGFYDSRRGGFFTTSSGGHEALIARNKMAYDSPLPSENATATRVCLRLFRRTGDEDFQTAANRTLALYRPAIATGGMARSTMSFARAVALRINAPAPKQALWSANAVHVRQDVFRVTAEVRPLPVAAGKSARLHVRIGIDDGWHVATAARGAAELDPTRIALAPTEGPSKALFQVTEVRATNEADTVVQPDGYAGAIGFVATVTVPPGLRPGRYTLPMDVHALACNAEVCRAPMVIRLRVPIVVGRNGRQGR